MKHFFLRFLLALCVVFPVPLFAQTTETAESFTPVIQEYNVDIQVNTDSSIDVTESILYDFGEEKSHGIFRTIPMQYQTEDSGELQLPFDVVSVTDEDGNPYLYQDNSILNIDLKIGDPEVYVTGQHWYVIQYHVDHVINGFEDQDELYWNVTGDEWDVTIQNVTVEVTVPGGTANGKSAACYTGYTNSVATNCTSSMAESTFLYTNTAPLALYEQLTIVAGFEKGLVRLPAILEVSTEPLVVGFTIDNGETFFTPQTFRLYPGTHTLQLEAFKYDTTQRTVTLTAGNTTAEHIILQKSWWVPWAEKYIPLAALPVIVVLLFLLWLIKGRDPSGRGTVIAQYEPPRGLTPGEMGVVVDGEAHMHDISASIIHLATLGYLKIRKETTTTLLKNKEDYIFIKVKPIEAGAKIPAYEVRLFNALFSSGTEVPLFSLKNSFYVHLEKIKKELYERVVEQGYFSKNPDTVRSLYFAFAMMFLVVGGGGFITLSAYIDSWWYILTWLVTSAFFFIVAKYMSRLSKHGAEVYEEILGFKKFIKLTEQERLKFFSSPKAYADTFEKYLPYAMVLELEEEWGREFQDAYTQSPRWYEGKDAMNVLLFSQSLRVLNHRAQQSLKSAAVSVKSGSRASSGFSGFGGGGFSGGGFGGGGGGRW